MTSRTQPGASGGSAAGLLAARAADVLRADDVGHMTTAARERAYWRGPQWPVIGWLFGWAFRLGAEADRLRSGGLRLLADGEFGEYYQPFTGEPLGSIHQCRTAAVALDWSGGV